MDAKYCVFYFPWSLPLSLSLSLSVCVSITKTHTHTHTHTQHTHIISFSLSLSLSLCVCVRHSSLFDSFLVCLSLFLSCNLVMVFSYRRADFTPLITKIFAPSVEHDTTSSSLQRCKSEEYKKAQPTNPESERKEKARGLAGMSLDERERERERENVCMCVCLGERERAKKRKKKKEKKNEAEIECVSVSPSSPLPPFLFPFFSYLLCLLFSIHVSSGRHKVL